MGTTKIVNLSERINEKVVDLANQGVKLPEKLEKRLTELNEMLDALSKKKKKVKMTSGQERYQYTETGMAGDRQ